MRAELKFLHSPDVPDLITYKPEIEDDFGFVLQVFVGPKGESGEESFDLFICTPKWLINNNSIEDVIIGKNYLIVFEYNYNHILEKLKKFVELQIGENWPELINKIKIIGNWEFENYRDYKN